MRFRAFVSRNWLTMLVIFAAFDQMIGTLHDGLVALSLVDAGVIGALVMAIIVRERFVGRG